jgi:P27 family predicted phage terminase small subunit
MTARKSNVQKLFEGTDRPDRVAPEAPRSEAGKAAPKPPSWLGRYGMAKWRELVPELESRRLLTSDSLSLLELLCAAWADFRRAQAIVRRGGSYDAVTEAGAVMHRKHPEVDQARDARKEYAGLLDKLTRLLATAEPIGERDPLDDFLDRRPNGNRSASG